MRLTTTLAAATIALSGLTSTAFAGGLQVDVIEPIPVPEVTATRSSWGVILPIAAVALLILLASSNEEEDEG